MQVHVKDSESDHDYAKRIEVLEAEKAHLREALENCLSYINKCVPLEARIKELESIVSKLPKTADGVTITPGMKVWSTAHVRRDNQNIRDHINNEPLEVVSWIVVDRGVDTIVFLKTSIDVFPHEESVEFLYSTEEAAQANHARIKEIYHERISKKQQQ